MENKACLEQCLIKRKASLDYIDAIAESLSPTNAQKSSDVAQKLALLF